MWARVGSRVFGRNRERLQQAVQAQRTTHRRRQRRRAKHLVSLSPHVIDMLVRLRGWPLRRLATAMDLSHETVRKLLATPGALLVTDTTAEKVRAGLDRLRGDNLT